MKIVLIIGSRNPNGQTARAASAASDGVSGAGGLAEQVFLPGLRIERCRQCDETGWGLCRREGRCVIDDDFRTVVQKVKDAQALIFATPVYYSDLSESMRAFCDRLRRTCTHEAGRSGIQGKPGIGLCVAGGGGGGAPACCVSLEKVMLTCGMDVVDMIPVRRQNLEAKLAALKLAGSWLARQGAAPSGALGSRAVCQVAVVVRDIEKSARACAELFGVDVPAWRLTDPEGKAHTRYRGEATAARAKLAFFQLDNISLELIEPAGGPSTWQEFLDAKGEGIHHIAFMVKGMEERLAALEKMGMTAVQRGDYTGGRYAYVDCASRLSLILELLENA